MSAFDPGALIGIAYACFVIAWVLYLACAVRSDSYLGRLGAWTQALGAAVWLGGWAWHVTRRGEWPSLTGQDLGWLVVAAAALLALWLDRLYVTRGVSLAVLPFVLAAGAWSLFRVAQPWPVASVVERSGWFVAYWLLAGLGFGALGVTAMSALLEVVRPVAGPVVAALPPPAYMARRVLGWALIALASALVVGAVRSWLALGAYWTWTPAEGWLLASWAAYLGLLHVAPSSRWWSAASFAGLVLVTAALRAMGV